MKAVLWLVLLGFLAFVSVHHQSSQGSCKGPGIFHQPVPRHSHSPRGYQSPTRPLVYFKAQKMAETAARPCPSSNLPPSHLGSFQPCFSGFVLPAVAFFLFLCRGRWKVQSERAKGLTTGCLMDILLSSWMICM